MVSISGVDWMAIVQSFLSSSSAVLPYNDVVDLVKAITKSESDFLQPDPNYEVFFKSFTVLSAECISSASGDASKSHVALFCRASRILLRFLLSRLANSSVSKDPTNVVSTKQLISAIKSLCTAKATLPVSDYVSLTALVATAEFPSQWKPISLYEKESSSKEPKKPRINLSLTFVEQLTTPLFDFSLGKSPTTCVGDAGKAAESKSASENATAKDIEKLIIQTNLSTLQSLKGGELLISLCIEAPYLSRYINKYNEALGTGKFTFPTTHSEANNIRSNVQNVANDIHMVSCALSLPIYEPLEANRLEQLSTLVMSCLYCAVCVAVASSILTASTAVSPKCSSTGLQAPKQSTSEDESLDCLAAGLVEKTLEIYSVKTDMIRGSTRTGGEVLQNHRFLGVWVLLSGLQAQLSTSNFTGNEKVKEEKGKSPVKNRDNSSVVLMKVAQGCVVVGVLSVALGSLCLELMSALLDDLLVEAAAQEGSQAVKLSKIGIHGNNTALQRAARFLSIAPLNQLLFYLATITYRKACTLKWIQKAPADGDGFNNTFSDSVTYYEEDLMSLTCSSSTSEEEDEDSDRILGQWFEETLAPAEPVATVSTNSEEGGGASASPRSGSLVPDKGEPHGYIILATQVFQFMNKHLLNNKSPYVWGYVKTSLAEQHMKMLAAIIRDLDRETSRTEVGTISSYFGATLGGLYSDFSQALARYTHNLLVCGILNESLQITLLSHLGVNPWSSDLNSWPLQVHTRTLAVLAQVLLLKQDPQEKEKACITIWNRLLAELAYNVCSPSASIDSDNEDVNVEHAQLVLFLFHSLNLMQKKSVLLNTANAVIKCTEAIHAPMKESQVLHMSRLVLFLDYLMRHLYDAPPTLIEQIQWNLFNATNMMVDGETKDHSKLPSRIFCPWRDIEDNYRKLAQSEEMSMKPRFYSLTMSDQTNQEQPKLDGLACNFILGTPDKLLYPHLMDALVEILSVADQCRDGLTVSGVCAVQYCFTITWRFLLLLPPSIYFLERLLNEDSMSLTMNLYSLVWGPRTGYKAFASWMKDCLMRQGIQVQYAESLLRSVSKRANSLSYDVNQAHQFINDFLERPITKPISLVEMCLLDSAVAKIQVLMDETISRPPDAWETAKNSPTVESLTPDPELAEKLLPSVISLADSLLKMCRSSMLEDTGVSDPLLPHVISLGSRWNPKTGSLGIALMGLVPPSVKTVAEKWNSNTLSEFPWNTYANDIIPAESYILAIVVNSHISSLSSQPTLNRNPSLQHLLYTAVTFITEQIFKCSDDKKLQDKAADVLLATTMDCSAEYLHMIAQRSLDKLLGDSESDAHQEKVYKAVLESAYHLICCDCSSGPVNDSYGQECLKFIEGFLEKPAGRRALEAVYTTDERDLCQVLISAADPNHSRQFSTKVFKFFLKLLSAREKNPSDTSLDNLCRRLSRLTTLPPESLQNWLRHVIVGAGTLPTPSPPPSTSAATTPPGATEPSVPSTIAEAATSELKDDVATIQTKSDKTESQSENVSEHEHLQFHHELLQGLTTYLTKEPGNDDVALRLLKAMIPIANNMLYTHEGTRFRELITVMTKLAASARGHLELLTAALEWLEILKTLLSGKEVVEKLESGSVSGKHQDMLDATCHLLSYLGDILTALKPQGSGRSSSPPWDGETPLDQDPDFEDPVPHDDDESGGEDSDEDSLSNKLCTFTITAKEFMNQHWYHCHTCNMVEGVGVCTVCARVCHRGHDITYSKYGNFFCDCGAKQDGTCQALSKRSTQSGSEPQPGPSGTSTSQSTAYGLEQMLQSSLRRRPSSPANYERSDRLHKDGAKISAIVKQLEGSKEALINVLTNSSSVTLLLNLARQFLPLMKANCDALSPVGCHKRGQLEMKRMHVLEKRFEETDQLMLPTLGSQEGAFENVKMNFSGEQGQTIRQLLSAHMVRRVAMCCLSSPQGKRQHLAVSHEKGKITVLQLSALLKQADSSKRKLTLTRLASAPIPFTVLSITGNPWNEDFLAVCGLKECHVVTFNSIGLVADHLVLHPQLEGGNFIIKAIWLPGSQTELALVTADFIKIYDLSKDATNPKYFFLVPAGKVRDCTFYCNESYAYHYILVMTSAGYICTQEMHGDSLAIHGPFFVMDVLECFHSEVKEINGQVEGGGVSVYYSHALQLLFFSYASGKSFVAPLPQIDKGYKGLPAMFMITWGKKRDGNASSLQPLCQWSEVPNHPGLIFSVMQNSNNPVILMVRPSVILVQEIKVVTSKAKIMDMVAIRHPSSNAEHRTTLILLCEDGSLRIYMASMQQTGFWLSSAVQAVSSTAPKPPRKRKVTSQNIKPSANPNFPVDFFEHCQAMNDVEFGGNDLLQVYNAQQIKHRLNTANMCIVSTKQAGFSVEVVNPDATMVMTGVRIFFSAQEAQRTPAYIEMFGRSIHTNAARNRWFDFPLHREESLQADKKLTITFGPSTDPDSVIMVDLIKVYGKTKDAFGWPEESEDVGANQIAAAASTSATVPANADSEFAFTSPLPPTTLEKTVSCILEALDGCFVLVGNVATDESRTQQRSTALEVATSLITLPTPWSVQMQAKALMSSLFPTKLAYHLYKDCALLKHAYSTLREFKTVSDPKDIDPEAFFRLVLTIRSVAVARPYTLTKFPDGLPPEHRPAEDEAGGKISKAQLISDMTAVLWQLVEVAPKCLARAPVCKPGITHTESVVQALVEVLHAFTLCDLEGTITEAAKRYTELLLCDSLQISFSARQALLRVLRPRPKRRKVFIPSPPYSATPGPAEATSEKGPVSQPSQDSSEDQSNYDGDGAEPIVVMPGDVAGAVAVPADPRLEAIMAGQAGFPLIDIPPDADDETMVELAIALSLQDHDNIAELPLLQGGIPALGNLNLQGLHVLAGQEQGAAHQEAGHSSDTTASAPGSDDEGSTAATDGSTLRTSPAEQAQGGSESGGSGVESIAGEHNVSGRSSAYGDSQEPVVSSAGRNDVASFDPLESETEAVSWSSLHELRLMVLQHLVEKIPSLRQHDGVHVIPFMQVLLLLTTDLDAEEPKDKDVLKALLSALNICEPVTVTSRSAEQQVHLVMMRFLSVLMSRNKSSYFAFVSQTTANFLLSNGVIKYCYDLLEELLRYWKDSDSEEVNTGTTSGNTGVLLKPHLGGSPPDMSPFFLMQYVKGHANDVFEAYPQLLTEMALRLPYQIQKHVDATSPMTNNFDNSWYSILCEYMMTQQTPFVRRQVRKLLLFLCGHKEKYRHLRDVHGLESHVRAVETSCFAGGYVPGDLSSHITLSYDALVELIEHLKACSDVALNRTANWQSFCLSREKTLSTLLDLSTRLDGGLTQTILELLQAALCCVTYKDASPPPADFERATQLVQQIVRLVNPNVLSRFIRTFLLENNDTAVRWRAHALILALYQHSSSAEQESLMSLMWKLWPQLAAYGRKAAHFVDLLGYFSLKASQADKKELLTEYTQQAVDLLRKQNQILAHHPNASLYSSLAQYVELDGYYLESEPCLVCNSPEVNMSNIKLSSIKIDSKFTTTTQFVKLVSSHQISRITLRISDLKRTKMVRTINVNYNNRSVQAVVELKNKTTVWHKAKKVSVASGQTEVKIDFPLAIIACNLMIEYADLYENVQATSETLQCPRCSASVPANPGVCGNCGENVFQCHKCRAINYDEKDPFLCHSCGFCKYAKFDYTLTARPCCAVDPIENDEDRNKTVVAINSTLEKADRVYRALMLNKPSLELLVLRINEHRQEKGNDAASTSSGSSSTVSNTGSTQVNKAIQILAQRYCLECKNSFDDLSKMIQRVVACRRELVAYDRFQREKGQALRGPALMSCSFSSLGLSAGTEPVPGRCYGCASAAADHCLTLLRALATSPPSRLLLCQEGLMEELVKYNLRKNPVQIQELLCLLTRDSVKATQSLCMLLMERIRLTLKGQLTSSDLAFAVRHDMALLAALVQKEDTCWEQKLRCVMGLLVTAGRDAQSPVVLESITLPCLKIIHGVMKPSQPVSKKNKDKPNDALLSSVRPGREVRVDARAWLSGDSRCRFTAWRSRMPGKAVSSVGPESARATYLMEKYAARWRHRVFKDASVMIFSNNAPWLKLVLFNPSSRQTRQVACAMMESLCQVPVRKREVLDLLTSYLSEIGRAGESAAEFLALYQNLIQPPPWKQYLAVKGILFKIADLLGKEIQELHRLEETSLTSDLAQGYALKMLTELLASFLEIDCIKQLYKGRLVGAVLNGYLSLRRLVVQRTRPVDDTQDKLLELLEEMTTGTEEETKAFMAICIDTVRSQDAEDIRTPVFIFERLCSIIYPEESDTGEFFLNLEKDPQQEDFLQGRMLGNPYSSNEPGLGPLMRDVKNKICQDCELVALLEDDNGMELLVNNKIISLNLPVREVYKRVWLGEGGDSETMRVVYRMRGLLGDATEEFVESLSAKTESEVNNEEVYKMANVMAECGGLEVMLNRLASIRDVTRARPLLQVLLKLFRLCVKVKRNQEVLIQPELNAIAIFLNVLKELCTSRESNASQASITEQLLTIMETILSKATSESTDKFFKLSETFGDIEHISALLRFTGNNSSASVLRHLMRVLATLTYGNESRMAPLTAHFTPVLDLNAFDTEHTPEDEAKLELFCVLTSAIERNAIGNTLKDHIVSLGIVNRALEYIAINAQGGAARESNLSRTDSDEWKEFISKPSLKYILRFLTGLAVEHEPTQLAVAANTIPIIHRLEQVSSDEHVGSLAENLLEALRSNPTVATIIEEVREQTRAEKKRLAMAMRERQLGALGMRTNDKGQVTASHSIMQQVEDLGEETGHVCVICREGYKFQPVKVLGIYTFTKRCNVEEYETKQRKTLGYTTVTHFNVVHVDCHMSAVRLARARDEWESAALQNANTKCNGLLPLWGPHVPESAFASCLARHNTYLQECTGHRDISYNSMVHDLKLLLLRFSQERSFHDDTGGGGPQSNMYLVPYLLHMALYVINTTRSGPREEKTLMSFVDCSSVDKWVESSYEAEGPTYMTTLCLVLASPARWEKLRLTFLKRLLIMAHVRHVAPSGITGSPPKVPDATVKDYSAYKNALVFFALVDCIYNNFFKKVAVSSEEQWPSQLADYIRHNDETMIKAAERTLATYRDELLPCSSLDEFCDVVGLLNEIPSGEVFLAQLLSQLA